MSLKDRSRKRLELLEVHRAISFADADEWDLDFWQRRSPEERLSALVAIHRDIEMVKAARAVSESR